MNEININENLKALKESGSRDTLSLVIKMCEALIVITHKQAEHEADADGLFRLQGEIRGYREVIKLINLSA